MTYGESETAMPTGRPPDPPPSQRTTTREEGRTMETGYTITSHELAEKEQIGIIEDLDRELSRLDELTGALSVRLGPISNQYDAQKVNSDVGPRPEPTSALRGRVERLRDICASLDRMLRDVEL